jgi:predicted amino acid-binding ACT domain protein
MFQFLLEYWHSGLVIVYVTTTAATTTINISDYAQMCIHYFFSMHANMWYLWLQ